MWCAEITDGDIKITVGRELNGRVELSAWADGVHGFIPRDEKLPRIGISPKRPLDQIARDVHRRLIPDARRIISLAREQKARYDKLEAERHETGRQIAAILETSYREDMGYIGAYHEPHHARVEVRHGCDVKWEIHLPQRFSIELAHFLKGLEAKWKGERHGEEN